MERFLWLYLLVTGIGALCVLAVPSLVILGFFALVVPGLILMVLPTAFLWGLIFTAFWWPLQRGLGSASAALLSALATSGIVIGVPTLLEAATFHMADHATVEPPAPVAPAGDLLVATILPPWDQRPEARLPTKVRPYNCDHLCLAFLFAPGVTSVTFDRSGSREFLTTDEHELSAYVRTYRLLPKSECAGRLAVEPKIATNHHLFGETTDDRQRLFDAWRQRLETEVCVVSTPPLEQFDLMIREDDLRVDRDFAFFWSPLPTPPETESFEIRDARGARLAYHADVTVRVVARPWLLDLPDHWNHGFGWGRSSRHNPDFGSGPSTIEDGVQSWTTLPATLR